MRFWTKGVTTFVLLVVLASAAVLLGLAGRNEPVAAGEEHRAEEYPVPPSGGMGWTTAPGESLAPAVSVRTAGVQCERVLRPSSEPTATPTLAPCTDDAMYKDWSKEAVTQAVITRKQARGEINGTPNIVRLADVYQADAQRLGVRPFGIAYGCEPDVAMVLEGDFRVLGFRTNVHTPYVLWVVDRWSGAALLTGTADNVSELLSRLPPE